ncbi:unnamed protein product, partial [Allacma fusca]
TLAVATNDGPTNENETNNDLQDAPIDNQNDNSDEIILLDQPLLQVEVNSLKVQILEKEKIIESLRSKLRGKDRKISKLQQKLSALEHEESHKLHLLLAGRSTMAVFSVLDWIYASLMHAKNLLSGSAN